MQPNKDAELIAVYGRRGTGKSTLTKGLLNNHGRVIVFDPRAEYAGRGWRQCRTLVAVRDAMAKKWAGSFKIAYVPPGGSEKQALSGLCSLIWQAQKPYEVGQDARKILLVIEEADLSLPVHQLPAGSRKQIEVCNQGRHMGIEAIAVTQRPAQLSLAFRGNAAVSYVFALAWEDDQMQISKMIGRKNRPMLANLQNYFFIKYEGGKVSRHKVSKTGQISAARG